MAEPPHTSPRTPPHEPGIRDGTAAPVLAASASGADTAPASRSARWLAAAAGVGIVLLAVSWLLLGDPVTSVPGWEADVSTAVNGWPGVLEWPLWPVMQLGTPGTYIVGGAGVYALTRRWRPSLATGVSVLLAWGAARLVKEAVERPRPDDLLDDLVVRGPTSDGYGYVSGHTTIAFALATALTAVLPGRWRWAPYPVAAVVGLARVYYGAHLPLDVVGGAGLGVACGVVAVVGFGAAARPATMS